jgi:hypothetical protein
MIFIFLFIVIYMRMCDTCQIETERCICINQMSLVQIKCSEDRFSHEIDLNFGKIILKNWNGSIKLIIKNKFISQIKTFTSESDYPKLKVSLKIENYKMKELKANSFENMASLNELFLYNDNLEIIQQD